MQPIDLLRELLRVRSISPHGNEDGVADILESYLGDAGLETKIVASPGNRANLVARVDGPRDRPALVLLSHSDVVPVEEDNWTRDPFGADIHDEFVWGRGALDMKGIAVMHAVAAAELARAGHGPAREVVVAVVADEEAGGDEGAKWLLEAHPSLVGFEARRPPPEVIGEGAYGVAGMLSRSVFPIALGEKAAVWFDIVTNGESGHGALPPQRQAISSLAALITQIAGFGTPRVHPVMREQFASLAEGHRGAPAAAFRALASPAGVAVARAIAPKLRKAGALGLLLSDSITPTAMAAGYKRNVVPGEARVSFDARLLPDTDIDAFISSIEAKARQRGGTVRNVVHKGHGPVSDRGPLFDVLQQASTQIDPNTIPTVGLSPGVSDLRFFRARGATGYGWSPLVLTPDLLATIHGHDERIPVAEFERAVTVMSDVVRRASE